MEETVVETVTEEPVELEATELTVAEEGTESPEISPEETAKMEMEAMAMRVVGGIRQIYQSGDQIVAILTHPDLLEMFTAAFRAIPEQILDPNLRDNVPIAADESVPQLRLVTGTDLEMQFLTNRYGRPPAGPGAAADARAQPGTADPRVHALPLPDGDGREGETSDHRPDRSRTAPRHSQSPDVIREGPSRPSSPFWQ
jgi:hypothetical protein